MQIIKIYRNAAWAVCLGAALCFAGCKGNGKTAGSDSAKTDSSTKKTDSTKTDSTKVAPADSGATPPSHVPKTDTSVKPRPLVRKT